MRQLLLVALLFEVVFTGFAYCAWHAEKVMLQLTFGDGSDEIGIIGGGPYDDFDAEIAVNRSGEIILSDMVNRNISFFDKNGTNVSMVSSGPLPHNYVWPSEVMSLSNEYFLVIYMNKYSVYTGGGDVVTSFLLSDGSFPISALSDGNILIDDNGSLAVYTQDGGNLGEYTDNDCVSRSIDGRYVEEDVYKYSIGCLDHKYVFQLPYSLIDYVSVSPDGSLLAFVGHEKQTFKITKCGDILGPLKFPSAQFAEYEPNPHGYEVIPDLIALYGDAVFGADGNVYTWKQTPETYSILKWEWVDDPNDPIPGPDAPSELGVTPSTTGLYLTWKASPQDPGCVDSYQIERAGSVDGSYSSIATIEAGTLNYNDESASAGSSYFYKVRASAGGSYSDYTETVSGTRPQ